MLTRATGVLRMSPRTAVFLATGIAGGILATCLYAAHQRQTVAPRQWAGDVCAALSPWRATVGRLTTDARTELERAATPGDAKQTLSVLLGGAETASERARRRVVRAGVPDVPGGSDTADRFVTALTRARNAYGRAKGAVAHLDAGQAAVFYDGVAAAFAVLNQEYGASILDTDSIRPEPLRRSFLEVPECQ